VVARVVRRLDAQDAGGEAAQVPRKLGLVQFLEGAGDDVPDEDARRELDDRGHRPAGGAGEDVDLDAPGGEALGHLDDVDVHPARVAGTWLIKRGSMNTDRRNPVDTTRHRTSPPVVQPTE